MASSEKMWLSPSLCSGYVPTEAKPHFGRHWDNIFPPGRGRNEERVVILRGGSIITGSAGGIAGQASFYLIRKVV